MKPFNQLKFKRLIIIAYRLPLKHVKRNRQFVGVQNSGGRISTVLSLSDKMKFNELITFHDISDIGLIAPFYIGMNLAA